MRSLRDEQAASSKENPVTNKKIIMKNYNCRVIEEVRAIVEAENTALVLIGLNGNYSVVNKYSHSFKLIDDEHVGELLIDTLLNLKVEIFSDFEQFQHSYPKLSLKPMFWPEEKPWPPN